MIILKDMKLGMSEKKILRNLHPDAEDYYNVTMDLKKVLKTYLSFIILSCYFLIKAIVM